MLNLRIYSANFPPGIEDAVWIPTLAHDGDWIVFSADLGKNSKKSESLPLICQEIGVTHIIMSPALQRRTSFYRVLAIGSCWTQILGTSEAAEGDGIYAQHEHREERPHFVPVSGMAQTVYGRHCPASATKTVLGPFS